MQYIIGYPVFFDLVHIAKSSIPDAGYGLFAATDLPKGIPFTIYLGRTVKVNNPKRTYTMQLNYPYVMGSNNLGRWEKVRKGRAALIIDALSEDNFKKWTPKRDFFLGAHTLNDLNFKNSGEVIPSNCVVQPMLEIVTTHTIPKDSDFFLNYNR